MRCGRAPKYVARQVVLRQRQQIAHGLGRLNLESAAGKFRLPLCHDVIKAGPQARFSIVALTKSFAEAVNHGAFQGGGKIGGPLKGGGVGSYGALFPARRFLSSLKVIIARTALEN